MLNGKKLQMHSTGPSKGLSLILSLQQENPSTLYSKYDIKDNNGAGVGVRAQIHATNTLPSPAIHGFDVPPDYSTSVGLRTVSYSRISQPYGDCSEQDSDGSEDFQDTLFMCLELCKQRAVVNTCRCKNAALSMHHVTALDEGAIPFCGKIKDWKSKENHFQGADNVDLEMLACEEKVMNKFEDAAGYERDCGCSAVQRNNISTDRLNAVLAETGPSILTTKNTLQK